MGSDSTYTSIIAICIFAMVVLLIQTGTMSSLERGVKKKLSFVYAASIIGMITEWVGWILIDTPSSYAPLHYFVQVIDFATTPLVVIVCGNAISSRFNGKTAHLIAFIVLAIEIVGAITGWIFYIDETNTMRYGALGFLQHAYGIIAIVYTSILLIEYARESKDKTDIVLIFMIALIVAGGVAQVYEPGFHTLYPAICFAITIEFIHYAYNINQKAKHQIMEQNKLMRALSTSYESLLHIDFEEDIVTPINISGYIDQIAGDFLRSKPSYENVIGNYVMNVVYEPDKNMLLEKLAKDKVLEVLQDNQTYEIEYRIPKGGDIAYLRVRISKLVEGDSFTSAVLTFADISSQKERWETLINESESDSLTGLGNRRAYDEEINRLMSVNPEELSPNLTIISMDLNGLKRVNDTMGHEVGDELLRGAAEVIDNIFGGIGKCFRLGGDEFVVILEVNENLLLDIAKNFDKSMSEWHSENIDSLSISYGWANVKNNPDIGVSGISRLADDAMYRNKDKYYKKTGIARREI